MKHVRHDGELRTARQQAHLKHIPDYLLPKEGRKGLTEEQMGFVGLRGAQGKERRGRRAKRGGRKGGGDPLKTFKARRRAK